MGGLVSPSSRRCSHPPALSVYLQFQLTGWQHQPTIVRKPQQTVAWKFQQTGDWIWQRGDGHDALPRIEGLPTASSRAVPLTNLRTIHLTRFGHDDRTPEDRHEKAVGAQACLSLP